MWNMSVTGLLRLLKTLKSSRRISSAFLKTTDYGLSWPSMQSAHFKSYWERSTDKLELFLKEKRER